jgi:spermidine/putrescine transport system permease protein/putrescine transport system permease protein
MSVAAERPAEVAGRRAERGRAPRRFDRPRTLWVVTGLVYAFLFAPILIVILFSFNSERSLQTFDGFSLRWYRDFFADESLRTSLFTSLEIAAVTTIVSTVLGTGLALGMGRARSRATARFTGLLLLIPLVTPEIVAGVSAFVLFAQLGIALSPLTIILAHITFSISYVCVVVRGRLAALGTEIEEAALDLGATPLQAVRLVTLPALWPAILAAGMLVFVLSFDDFVLSFFTTGESPQPLPVRIYSALRFGISPTINAIGTLMLLVSVAFIALAVLLPRLLGRRETGVGVLTGRSGS